jgi:type II secretory pathway component PulF
MKLDEFAFVNQQLAGMLRSGIPLEGSLRQLCATMRAGGLRDELQKLEADLAGGRPLAEALKARQLPPLYAQMLQVGAQSNDLPGVLTLLADYYERLYAIWTRIKGLLIYPMIVLGAALLLSLGLSCIFHSLATTMVAEWPQQTSAAGYIVGLWLTPGLLALVALGFTLAFALPGLRAALRWRVPGFREARLSQVATALGMLLRGGSPLPQALDLVRQIEPNSAAAAELAQWQNRLSQGQGKAVEFAREGKVFPPLFRWLVASGGEDLAGGFQRAAEIYYARAVYRVDLMLYAFLPVSVIVLGMMLVGQIVPAVQMFRSLGLVGDMGLE